MNQFLTWWNLKIAILGRGFAGLSLAWEMQLRGHQVVVVGVGAKERGHGSALRPASYAAVGISSIKGHFLPDSLLFSVKLKAHAGLEGWLQQVERCAGIPIPRFKGRIFEPFYEAEEFIALHERIYHGNPTGLYRNRIVGSEDLCNLLQGARIQVSPLGAFEFFEDLWFDPQRCLEALEVSILKKGGTIVEGCLEKIGEVEGDQLTCLIRPLEEKQLVKLVADRIVFACGSHTNDALKKVGPNLSLPVHLCTGVTLNYNHQASLGAYIGLRHKKTNTIVFNNKLIVGSSSINHLSQYHQLLPLKVEEKEGNQYLEEIDPKIKKMGCLDDAIKIRWGARLRAKDRYPVMGPLMELGYQTDKIHSTLLSGIWIFTGLYKNGLQISWLLARELATAIEKSATNILNPRFSLRRLN